MLSEWAEPPPPLSTESRSMTGKQKSEQNGRTLIRVPLPSVLRHNPVHGPVSDRGRDRTGGATKWEGVISFGLRCVFCFKTALPLTAWLLVAVWLLCGMLM